MLRSMGGPRLIVAACCAGACLVAGCVATVEDRAPRVVYVAGPPPAPLHDVRGGPTAPNTAWVEGYWHWNGVHYVWIPGHWEAPPPGSVWVPPSYAVLDGRYVYRAGRWDVPREASGGARAIR